MLVAPRWSARSVPDREQTRRALTEHRYRRHVQTDARRAKRLGATGAPLIVADGRYAVPGAQTSDTLLNLLRTTWGEAHPVTVATGAPACGSDGCTVPIRS
ncbi:Protein-disulfide isomerase OS=Streptomyces canus OX=58343 GN=AQJ46_50445 PE=4 SV=1 [Streptomyces canus]